MGNYLSDAELKVLRDRWLRSVPVDPDASPQVRRDVLALLREIESLDEAQVFILEALAPLVAANGTEDVNTRLALGDIPYRYARTPMGIAVDVVDSDAPLAGS